ncbi:hypothetical protein KR009_007218 [Drosophila setifemur]|nr:hypothetical protein KR009_007218 [Drosophila setifemur]
MRMQRTTKDADAKYKFLRKMKTLWLLKISLLILLLLGSEQVESKVYSRCELARPLLQSYQFNRSFISIWICTVEHESNLDTRKITAQEDGSKSYGLFQINSRNYCTEGRPGGYCNKKCEDFVNDEIADDAACAKMIHQREGFKYWKGWNRYCRNWQTVPNVLALCPPSAAQLGASSTFAKL